MNYMRCINFKVLLVWILGVLVAVATTASTMTPQPAIAPSQSLSVATSSAPAIVKSTVTYRELVALAADVRVTVQLVDVSRADGAEVVLGEQAIKPAGRPFPFEFEIGYDPASIRPDGVYVVGANIAADGKLVYQTTTRLGVITQGQPTVVQLVLTKISP